MREDRSATEIQILNAARKVFQQKGMKGARMQEIADLAGINKAMLHYYFRNKDQLFKSIYAQSFAELAAMMNEIIEGDLPLFDKIRAFVDSYVSYMMKNPFLPSFVINEAEHNPDFLKQLSENPNKPNPLRFLQQIEDEINKGRIKPIQPLQLHINMISLCIFPIIGRHLLQTISQSDDETFQKLLEARKKEVADFIINAIKNE